jgi:hypothetical protein
MPRQYGEVSPQANEFRDSYPTALPLDDRKIEFACGINPKSSGIESRKRKERPVFTCSRPSLGPNRFLSNGNRGLFFPSALVRGEQASPCTGHFAGVHLETILCRVVFSYGWPSLFQKLLLPSPAISWPRPMTASRPSRPCDSVRWKEALTFDRYRTSTLRNC